METAKLTSTRQASLLCIHASTVIVPFTEKMVPVDFFFGHHQGAGMYIYRCIIPVTLFAKIMSTVPGI